MPSFEHTPDSIPQPRGGTLMTALNEVTVPEDNPRPASADLPSLAHGHEIDEGDGSLVIQGVRGPLHYAAPEITIELRHMVARLEAQEKGGFPARLALTSALSGEGVTFVTRSLAAVLANDLDRQICLVDLNWWSADAARSSVASRSGMAGVVAGDLEVAGCARADGEPAPLGRACWSCDDLRAPCAGEERAARDGAGGARCPLRSPAARSARRAQERRGPDAGEPQRDVRARRAPGRHRRQLCAALPSRTSPSSTSSASS